MKALTKLDLDLMAAGGCSDPNCKIEHPRNMPLFMHSACHNDEPTWVKYHDGQLTIMCAVCRKTIAIVQVAQP